MHYFQPMEGLSTENLSRRERQIMDLVYRLGKATAADVQKGLPDEVSYSAVRALLTVLEEKGYLKHEKEERRFIYSPTIAPHRAKKAAVKKLLTTFFDNSAVSLVESLLDPGARGLSADEIEKIKHLIQENESKAKS